MPNQNPVTKAALERALAEIHTDRPDRHQLIRMGIYRIHRDGRLHNGRSAGPRRAAPGRPCIRKARENGRCPNHGSGIDRPKNARARHAGVLL